MYCFKGALLKEVVNFCLLKGQLCKIYIKGLLMRVLSKGKSSSFIKGAVGYFLMFVFISIRFWFTLRQMFVEDTPISNYFLPQFEMVIDFTPILYQWKLKYDISETYETLFTGTFSGPRKPRASNSLKWILPLSFTDDVTRA